MKPQRPALVLLLVGSTAVAADSTAADLAVRARQILVKHCSECHGEKPNPSTLTVVDHAKLLGAKGPVTLIRPGATSGSQVVELIEEGSMPPGDRAKVSKEDAKILRDWIESGAGQYPIRFDDEFAYRTILEDVKKLPAADIKNTRYLTLHYLAADGSNADITTARKDFIAGVQSVIKKNAPGPEPLDATQTVFRLDIAQSDWGSKAFTRLNNKGGQVGNPLGNLFDVVLLEYPYGVIPRQSAAFDELVPLFLAKAEQVRPFAFVRGDWFVDTVTTAPLADDLHELMRRFKSVPPGLSTPKPPLARRPEAAATPPDVVALPALDAWYGPDPPAHAESPANFTTDTYDRSMNQVKRQFVHGDRFRLRYGADVDAYFQYLWIDAVNMITPSTVEDVKAKARGEKSLPDEPTDFVRFEGDGKEKFRVYAAQHKFPEGEAWRLRNGKMERYVHPFFAIKEVDGKISVSTDDAKIARKTIPSEIAPKK